MTIDSIKDFAAILNEHVAEMGTHYPGDKAWSVDLSAEDWRTLENLLGDNRRTLEAAEDRVRELEGALKRLASPETFTSPFYLGDSSAANELRARMDYAAQLSAGTDAQVLDELRQVIETLEHFALNEHDAPMAESALEALRAFAFASARAKALQANVEGSADA